MDSFDKSADCLLDLTDSEESSSSSNTGLFDSIQPLILELHELKKDEPAADTITLDSKIKKKKRKKNKAAENKSATSSTSSVSDSAPTVTDTTGKEEFYDANESYHALAAEDSQSRPAASLALTEHEPDKRSERRSSTVREPSVITKSIASSEWKNSK